MSTVSDRSLVCGIIVFIVIISEDYEVEARPKEVIPVPGWFNSVKGFVVPDYAAFKVNGPDIEGGHIDSEELFTRRKNKKRKKVGNKNSKKIQEDENLMPKETKKKKKKKNKRKKLMFIKSNVNNIDNNSYLSNSNEKDNKKPVDIIVHIKMKD